MVFASTRPQLAAWLHYSVAVVFVKPLVCVIPACSDALFKPLLRVGQHQLSFADFANDRYWFSIRVGRGCLNVAVRKTAMRERLNSGVSLWCRPRLQSLIRTATFTASALCFTSRFPSFAWTPLFLAAAVFSCCHCRLRYHCCPQSRRSGECLGYCLVYFRRCVATR